MAHQVEQMFSVKQTPWHGLGRIIQEAPNVEEAIRLAGLDWTVSKRKVTIPGVSPEMAGKYRGIVRDSDGTLFNILTDDYTPLQNSEAFQFFNPFIDSGSAQFETAGSLRGGRNVWILAKLNKKPITVGKDDEVIKFLLLSNGHDGSMAVRIGFTPIRVVCANTLAMSHGNKQSNLIRIAHTKKVAERVDQIQEVVNAADATFEATAEQYKALAQADVSKSDLEKYVRIVFKIDKMDKERRQMAQDRMVKDITRLFETGRGANLKSANGTYWGLYNAVTEYLSYERKAISQDSRLFSLWFSDSSKVNDHALKTAVEMVAV